eukprot:7930830-Alexandrium_andersonii.AAC.1
MPSRDAPLSGASSARAPSQMTEAHQSALVFFQKPIVDVFPGSQRGASFAGPSGESEGRVLSQVRDGAANGCGPG